jgi:hypothetical protein
MAGRPGPRQHVVAKPRFVPGYEGQAVALLRQAVQPGFHDLKYLKTNDPDLAPLRGRADFQQLVQELETKSK